MKKQNPIQNQKDGAKSKKKRMLITFICIFVALALIVGATFATVISIKNANAVVSYEGITMDEGVASFFISYYKYRFISVFNSSGVSASDSEAFWNSEYYSGTTYGEYFKLYAERYLMEIVAANYLYDKYSSLTSEDKKKIVLTISEVLTYKADGSKDTFNEACEGYGFDYSDFKTAAKMMYKAQKMRTAVFGADGEKLVNFPDECNDYFSKYSHVKLLFIRTEDKFLLDAEGNRITENGNDVLVELSETEKAERRGVIESIRTAIAGYEADADVQMSPEMFNTYLEKYGEGDSDMNASGYYFYTEAEYTADFYTEFPDIVELSYSMDLGSYAEVATDFGVCFIYKYANTSGAYTDTSVDGCFSDFYSDAADYLFAQSIETTVSLVSLNQEKVDAIDFIAIKQNNTFVPRF